MPDAPCNSIIEKPWALVMRGGTRPNGLPFTRMAFLVEAVFKTGRGASAIVAYRARVGNADLTGWTAHNRPVRCDEILARWFTPPTPREIKRAKRAAFLEIEQRRQQSLPLEEAHTDA